MNLTDREKRTYSEAAVRGVKLTPTVAAQFEITEDTKMEYNVKALLAQPKQSFAELRAYMLALANYDLTNNDCQIMSGEGRKAFREAAYSWLENYAARKEDEPIADFIFNKAAYYTSTETPTTALGQAIESASTGAQSPSVDAPSAASTSELDIIRADVSDLDEEDVQAYAETISGEAVEPDQATDIVVNYVFNQRQQGSGLTVRGLTEHLWGDEEDDEDEEFDRARAIQILAASGILTEGEIAVLSDEDVQDLLADLEDEDDDGDSNSDEDASDEDEEDFEDEDEDEDDHVIEALTSGDYITGALPDIIQMRHTTRAVLLLDLSRIPMAKEDLQNLRSIGLDDGTECNFVVTLNPGTNSAAGYAYTGLDAVLQALSTLNEANNHIIANANSIAMIHNAIAANMSNILEQAFVELSGINSIESEEDQELVDELNERVPLYKFDVIPSLTNASFPELESLVFLTIPVPSISTSDTLNRLISIVNEMVQEYSSIEVDIYATVNAESILNGGDKLRTLVQSVNMLSKRELIEHINENTVTDDEDDEDEDGLTLYADDEFKMPGNGVNTQLYVPYLLPNDCSHVAYLATVSSYGDEEDDEDEDDEDFEEDELFADESDDDFDHDEDEQDYE